MQSPVYHYDPSSEFYLGENCYITELLNTDADSDVSIARARVLPAQTTRWHSLTGTVERYVILEGEGLVEVGDQPPTHVKPGDTVLIPAECPQRIANVSSEDLVFLAVCSPRFRPENYCDLEAQPSG
ncbi:cupin domain-containing protein [Marinobacter sp. CHS3-4]|uniref:cupin domain-containing protein n=1 Tax=Marinobacter sp. CHS3-4 TaxID=3045174 RepID=UPI0024B524A9|nr:cupin domain-containing protein [Marinobacter sp. CHS3-4]MDI9246372.1 cupin domain-containing protein [Marinobacter sp. CHS3-4]